MKAIASRGLHRTPVPDHPAEAHLSAPVRRKGPKVGKRAGRIRVAAIRLPGRETERSPQKSLRGDGGVAPECEIQADLRGRILLLAGAPPTGFAPSGGKLWP